jgi:hypothetical protein
MRAELIELLAAEPVLCGGRLALLGNVGAALDALDGVTSDGVDLSVAGDMRVVVSDAPERPLVLTVYRGVEPLAVVELPPIAALTLTGRLLDAAGRRLRYGEALWGVSGSDGLADGPSASLSSGLVRG